MPEERNRPNLALVDPSKFYRWSWAKTKKIRRMSTSGYQRLSENSFSPPSEETVRINLIVNFHVFLIILILDAYNTFSHKNRLQPSHDAAIAAIVGRFQSVPKSQRCQSYSYQYLPEIPRKIQSARRTTAVPGWRSDLFLTALESDQLPEFVDQK